MEKEAKILERVIELEKEVLHLRSEVNHLKQHIKIDVFEPKKVNPTPQNSNVTPLKLEQDEVSDKIPAQPVEPVLQKEKRSLEEIFTRALPRIFTVILVLGVLWGLKLVSDYGFLSDSIKIISGFILSLGLITCAFVMEKKQKGSHIVALSIYGGAFIVGILTTAAGAIIYDVLGLYTALIIALIYIVYGVAISYLKSNEALTVLVIFTSLLLPYLLEYMNFDTKIIGIFIVLLFTGVQVVIVKHAQRKALYIGMAFSVLALTIVSGFHMEQSVFFAVALVVLYSVFLVSYLHLYRKESKRNAAMLFSFTIFILTTMNSLLFTKETTLTIVLLIMFGILSFATYVVFKRKYKLLIDIFGTLTLLTLLNVIAQLNISRDFILLLLVIVAFAGLMLAIKHAITFMKWVYSLIFTLLGLIVLVFCNVQPFLSIEHVTLLVLIVLLVILYLALRHFIVVTVEKTNFMLSSEDVFPIIIYFTVLVYIWKIDLAYMPTYFTTYMLYGAIAIFFVTTLIMKHHIVGRLLPLIAATVYGVAGLKLFSSIWIDDQTVIIALVMRLIYIGLLWAILVDAWKQGAIYKNYATIFERYTEQLTIAGMILSVIVMFNLTSYMDWHDLINWNSAVIINTVSIFIAACLSLYLAAIRSSYRNLKLTGIGLLFFGIIKMIFFDLSALDLLIRSISFIIIGAIGLIISNKLLVKEKK